MPKNTERICIVGAGAAGISAAYYLNKKGYQNIVLLEKNDRIGGKCNTILYQGKAIEMGALYMCQDYTNLLQMAKEIGAELLNEPQRGIANIKEGNITYNLALLLAGYNPIEVALAVANYTYNVGVKYREYIESPGMVEVPEDLIKPFSQWLTENGMESLTNLFVLSVAVFGYGCIDTIPAAYILRFMNFTNFFITGLLKAFGDRSWPKILTNGYQDLFTRVAARLNDVRLNVNIDYIERGSQIKVYYQGKEEPEIFDKLIVTCCLDSNLKNLLKDLSKEAEYLFSQTQYNELYTTLCTVKNFPNGALLEYPLTAKGHAWGMLKTWEEVNACVFYSVGDKSKGLDGNKIFQFIQEDVERLGFRVDQIIDQKQWNYFPHVSCQEIAAGHFEKLEALQGRNSTYFSGGLLCFETVHNVVNYSKDLVEKYF